MAMNKFMHPRNKYKTPPNFTDLAIEYPEFRIISTLDVNGKVKIDFKDEKTLRILTKCLLHKDFKLDVILPADKLIPTLPLRLNYILWIEDILAAAGTTSNVSGIDIGCGASCIYGLIGAKQNHWKMFALEANIDSCSCANTNVQRNQLEDLIKIIPQDDNTRIFDKLQQSETFNGADFCVCNPPFFSTLDDLNFDSISKNRTGNRPSPHNSKSGSNDELVVTGGECDFVQKIIEESCQLRSQVKIYTTMLGHRSSVSKIVKLLLSHGITNFTQTEFCQGHTTRWGIAWTFCADIFLRTVPSYGQNVTPNKIFDHTIAATNGDVGETFKIIQDIFLSVNLKVQNVKLGNSKNIHCNVVAPVENTWSRQRQRRREMERRDKPHLENQINSKKEMLSQAGDDGVNRNDNESIEKHQHPSKRRKLNDCEVKLEDCREPFLVFQFSLQSINDQIRLSLEYLFGRGGKDAVYQILQFLINRLR